MTDPRFCARHPQTETRLHCSECDIPICPRCMVLCEVGIKCPACVSSRKSHLLQVQPGHYALVWGAAAVLGWLFGNVALPLLMAIPFYFGWLLAFVIGRLAGEAAGRLVRYKKGLLLCWLAWMLVLSGFFVSDGGGMVMALIAVMADAGVQDPARVGSTGGFQVMGLLRVLAPAMLFAEAYRRVFKP